MTWADVITAAKDEPCLQIAVTAVDQGLATREEALIIVALTLAEHKRNVEQLIRDTTRPRRPFLV